jgi:hypothetical protein
MLLDCHLKYDKEELHNCDHLWGRHGCGGVLAPFVVQSRLWGMAVWSFHRFREVQCGQILTCAAGYPNRSFYYL